MFGMTEGVVREDLAYNFRYFFLFGNFLGILPCSGLNSGNCESITFSRKSASAFHSIVISIFLAINTIVAMIGLFMAKQINSFLEFSYYAISLTINAYALFIYVFLLRNAEQLLALLKLWKEMGTQYKHALMDQTLTRDGNIIAGIILTSAVLENNLWAIKDSRILDNYFVNHPITHCGNNSLEVASTGEGDAEIDPLEEYFKTYHQWRSLVSYNPWIAVYLFVTNKCVVYSWNYCDVLVILIARALYMKFKMLNTQFEERLRDANEDYPDLKDAIDDHVRLTKLLLRFQDLLSPLIFASYFVNVYFVCMHLMFLTLPMKEILGPELLGPQNMLTTIQLVWSAVHLITRLYVVTLVAAQVVDHGLKIKTLLYKVPPQAYTREVERFEVSLEYPKPEFGLNGLGCFTITKSFMLDIFSVFFTIEIVLFQSSKLRWH